MFREDWEAVDLVARLSGMRGSPKLLEEHYRNNFALRPDFGKLTYVFYARVEARVRCYLGRGMGKNALHVGKSAGRMAQEGRFLANSLIPQIYIPAFFAEVLANKAIVIETRRSTGI
jgi:hypothetical protein